MSQPVEDIDPDTAYWRAFGKELAKGAADVVTDETPGIAQAKAAEKILYGRNSVTGEENLGWFERVTAVVDLIPGGSTFKRGAEGLGTLLGFGKSVDRAADAAKTAKRAQRAARAGDAAVSRVARQADTLADAGTGVGRSTGSVDEFIDSLTGVDTKKVGICFLAGTQIVQHPDGSQAIEITTTSPETESTDRSSLLLAATATVIAIAGVAVPILERRTDSTDTLSWKSSTKNDRRKAR